jgi:hypothetical protein
MPRIRVIESAPATQPLICMKLKQKEGQGKKRIPKVPRSCSLRRHYRVSFLFLAKHSFGCSVFSSPLSLSLSLPPTNLSSWHQSPPSFADALNPPYIAEIAVVTSSNKIKMRPVSLNLRKLLCSYPFDRWPVLASFINAEAPLNFSDENLKFSDWKPESPSNIA